MITLSPVDLVLRVSAAPIGASEVPANSNAGPYVERVLKRVGLPKGNPWCAALVSDIGAIALGNVWPLPLTGGCAVLGDFATKHTILFEKPEVGDVFLVFHASLGRFGHTGFVIQVNADGSCRTREGNTTMVTGSREGWLYAERTRTFAPKDRFIRWANLL